MRDVFVAGAAVAPFGKHKDSTPAELGGASALDLMQSVGVSPDQVDTGFVGSVYGGSLIAQRVLQRVGISGQPIFSVENACASGGSAVNLAFQAIASGVADSAVVVGVDQLSTFGGGALPLTTADVEISQGVIMPATYAMRAQRYLHQAGADPQVLDRISVKNRGNGAHNPRAHFQKSVTLDDVAQSRMVADPLKLLHCCPNSDGAAALFLCSEDFGRDLTVDLVRMRASVVRSGQFHTSYRDMTWPDITERAARAAYEMAGITAADLDVVELHDAFAVAELLHAEALGLTERWKAHVAITAGEFDRDGRVAVSPSGGLLSRGHPVGASGVSQLCEMYWQITGTAGDLQVPGASVALTHTTGGGIFGVDNGACSVHVLTAD